MANIENSDHVFLRLLDQPDILATFEYETDDKVFVTPITKNSPCNPEGYAKNNILTMHYVDTIQNPKK